MSNIVPARQFNPKAFALAAVAWGFLTAGTLPLSALIFMLASEQDCSKSFFGHCGFKTEYFWETDVPAVAASAALIFFVVAVGLFIWSGRIQKRKPPEPFVIR